MRRKIISAFLSFTMLAAVCTGFAATASAAANTPKYQSTARQMEKLNRGLIAAYRTTDSRTVMQGQHGVYLSWRLLGDESLTNQAFDIYKNGIKIYTTGVHDATNYIDITGTINDKYKVVKAGESADNEPEVTPWTNHVAKGSEVGNGNSYPNSFAYIDIPIVRPDPVKRMGDGNLSYYYTYDSSHEGGANDASVGDLDGDGDYELILKWDPTDSKDSAGADYTGNVYIDAYEIDPNNGGYMWRIDLGKNVTAGAHYTQYIVYDFDGDGKSEIAMKTGPGTIDGTGKYVTEVGDTEEIRKIDNTKSYIGTSGGGKGKNIYGKEFLTVFDGETGAALATTEYIPLGKDSDWNLSNSSDKYNRAERFLAGVAYLDGVHPSIIMCRGYYAKAVVRAYNWDGNELSMLWEHNSENYAKYKTHDQSLYGQGAHSLSVADIDNDGKDEIIYCSAALDDNGVAIGNTKLGHGDALHVNDFNNDGIQEAFSVKEEKAGYTNNAADFRVPTQSKSLWGHGASGDTGRGVMANIDDDYASKNSNALSLAWSSSHANVFDLNGTELKAKPGSAGKGSFDNSLVFWDGDLGRELLDANIIQKYDAANGWTKRFWGETDGYTLTGATFNNYTKRNASLSADLWGDWREEIIMPVGKTQNDKPVLRIFTSTLPTDYRLTTLMHDSQYRCAIAWQNVGYNQPPHTSYYIGSAALATDESGNKLNYLAPAVPFTTVTYQAGNVAVTGMKLSDNEISIEKGKSSSINAIIEPSDASKKSVTWTSSDNSVATVTNGVITAVSEGSARITAETKDGGFKDTCTVNVYANHATGVTLSKSRLELGPDVTKQLAATVEPSEVTDASVTWKSSAPNVAVVDDYGNVTGVTQGKAVITATTVDGGYTDECEVYVLPLQTVDATGENVFAAVGTTDSGTTVTGAANGVTIAQKNAASGVVVEKAFEAYSDNRATLSFKITTGGQRIDGSNWNWTGHEYSFGLKFLDTEGDNILTISQAYTSSAQTTMSQIFGESAKNVSSWTKSGDGENPLNRSTTRWIVNLEFDYDTDTCKASIAGSTSDWVEGDTYTTTFPLNGASFEKMQYYTTKDGNGTISVSPTIADIVYERTETKRSAVDITSVDGNTANIDFTVTIPSDSAALIGALYDADGIVREVKYETVENPAVSTIETDNIINKRITFDNNISDYKLKVYLWTGVDDMEPLTLKPAER